MKKWQIKIIVRNKYPYTSDTYDEIIREYYDTYQKASDRMNFVLFNHNVLGGKVVSIEMKEMIAIRKVEK